jgi:3-dehydroquinate dehydratase-1
MKNNKPLDTTRPLVVATVHTVRGWALAADLPRGDADLVEIRLDCLARHTTRLRREWEKLCRPVILTARHPSEGGVADLKAPRRRDLLMEFLPGASLVDVELRSVRSMAPVLEEARRYGLRRIISLHDFRATPPLVTLRRRVRAAVAAGADIIKIATHLRGPQDLATLLQLQAGPSPRPLALMGMGALGRVSRLVLAAGGSCLNYGYLDRPQVAGQWPAAELRDLLGKILR